MADTGWIVFFTDNNRPTQTRHHWFATRDAAELYIKKHPGNFNYCLIQGEQP